MLDRASKTLATLLIALLIGVAGALSVSGVAPKAQSAVVKNPLAGGGFYVDPQTTAAWAVKAQPRTAPYARVIADTPQTRWMGDWNPTGEVRAEVDRYLRRAGVAGTMPVLALYAIPHRDCGGFSAGGLANRSAYAAWIDQVVAGVAGRRVAVVLEPDALASASCLSARQRSERFAMLKDAVTRLGSSTSTTVYLDAGHSRWLDAGTAASRLRLSGVSLARGFSLNVSNFNTTRDEVAYGERLAALVGGKRYVVDTSRNGLGRTAAGPLDWCNPAGRGLGLRPTTLTAGPHADAYLWVKHPGESDGQCGRREPAPGAWFSSYAVGLVQRAKLG